MVRPERRVLCTYAVGPHAELYEITRPTFERYAIKHGYDLIARTDPIDAGGRPAPWAKLVLIRSLLERYDVVVWIDSDAVIVDPSTDIAAGLSRRRAAHVVWHDVDDIVIPNLGVIVMHRSRRAARLLASIWQREGFIDYRWWENAAFIEEIGGDGDVGLTREQARRAHRRVGVLAHRWNSVPPCPALDPAIVHFAGVDHATRVEQMTALVDAVRHG